MTGLELLIAWVANLAQVATAFAIAFAIMAIGTVVGPYIADDVGEPKTAAGMRAVRRPVFGALVASCILASIPSPQNLWEVRVALLKLEVVSPENLKAGQEHLTEIVKSLECKHLGVHCPEKKEGSK